VYQQYIDMYDSGCQICCNYMDAGIQMTGG